MRNNSGQDFPLFETLHEMVERQARLTPQALAVRYKDDVVTYDVLNRRANQLAHYLRTLGAGTDVVIGIAMPRSVDMIVAVLAVLKSGAAYLPLDLEYPSPRLALMVEDAGIEILCCKSASLVSFEFSGRLIAIDGISGLDAQDIARKPEDNPASASCSADLAYLIFTSGSTGTPKGAELSHRNAVNLVYAMRDCFRVGCGDVVLAVVSLSFDISVFDIFVALCNGACVSVAPSGLVTRPRELFATLESQAITYMFSTPATFKLMVDAGLPRLPALTAILGGDVVPTDLGEALLARLGSVWIVYGPTEVTVLCTAAEYYGGKTYLGAPIANTEILILDEAGARVGLEEIGELCVVGEGVGRGYRNRPELTAARFVRSTAPDAVAPIYYKTGDLARYDVQGNLEFHGRIDRQVKIRGYRVEIGEIEVKLRQHPLILDAVVVPFEDRGGVASLAAYYTARRLGEGVGQSLASFRRHLRAELPEFMVPSVYVQIPELPLDQNRKVNRRALPPPVAASQLSSEDYLRPRTAAEKLVASIWSEALDRDDIGIHENFFELGGHSLMAVSITLAIEEGFGISVPLDALWTEGGTIASMSAMVESITALDARSRLVTIRQGDGLTPPLFVVHTVRGSVNEYQAFASHLPEGLPVIGVRSKGLYGDAVPVADLVKYAENCVDAILREHKGPYRLIGYSIGGRIAFEAVLQMRALKLDVDFLGMFDTQAPGFLFQPEMGSVMRKKLRGVKRRVHNLLSDGPDSDEADEAAHIAYLNPVEAGVDVSLLSEQARALYASLMRAEETYRPAGSCDVELHLFVARFVSRVDRERLLGWGPFASAGVAIHRLEAVAHLDVMAPAHARNLADAVSRSLPSVPNNRQL